MAVALDVLSWALFLVGGALVLVGAIGVIRFPDFYTRLHAAGVTDTMGADLIIVAMMLQAPNFITVVKLALILVFLVLTSPVSTHAIAHAAWVGGFRPRVGTDLHYADPARGDEVYPDEERD